MAALCGLAVLLVARAHEDETEDLDLDDQHGFTMMSDEMDHAPLSDDVHHDDDSTKPLADPQSVRICINIPGRFGYRCRSFGMGFGRPYFDGVHSDGDEHIHHVDDDMMELDPQGGGGFGGGLRRGGNRRRGGGRRGGGGRRRGGFRGGDERDIHEDIHDDWMLQNLLDPQGGRYEGGRYGGGRYGGGRYGGGRYGGGRYGGGRYGGGGYEGRGGYN